jgi:hypothetical protein
MMMLMKLGEELQSHLIMEFAAGYKVSHVFTITKLVQISW